ncbi:hypothetical protein [Thiomicrorhabdus sp.]|uniref:hypothetical protein n=1 Tax=Thiomicrorhabdus sp. TaxID=2039724 RepID=UPI0029C7DF93|nr:hypothetical protein [Thiomicrorhabdus sp.]
MPRIAVALLIQAVAVVVLAGLVYLASFWIAPPYNDLLLVGSLSFLTVFLSALLGMASWWLWIQFVFPWSLYLLLLSPLSPWWGLVIALLIVLLFKNAFKEQVPLYLTNAKTRQALAMIGRQNHSRCFIDLGCGFGENVRFMTTVESVVRSVGVETSPLVFWIAKWRSRSYPVEIHPDDLWQVNLAEYDLVYAFLSPKPMATLWLKVQEEMPENGWFVSNSFHVPDAEPDDIWVLNDRRQTHLYLYKIGGKD